MTSTRSSSSSPEDRDPTPIGASDGTDAAARSPAREPSFPFDNSYARLPDTFYARVAPTPVAKPELLRVNRPLAAQLGLDPDALASPHGVEILSGNRLPPGADAIALAYAGHQFGRWVPVLGDGRAILLGELIDRDGVRRDVQLKGAGRTPFSRMGDGRAGLGPVLREYILSEAMAALGIPTTRALAMVSTGELVPRPQRTEPGAVLTRIATAHVRVGTFEYFARNGDLASLRRLADYAIERLYPDAVHAENPYRALLEAVILRQADLIAQWMLVGFIHGVMNTDNVSIAGETIDYGPCAFMDTYHPATVYSSIDHGGRYAYNQQPRIGHWNLARFAETLLPLIAADENQAIETAHAALATYSARFEASYVAGLRRKLGLHEDRADDASLAERLLEQMAEQRADFTLTFRALCDVTLHDTASETALRAQLPQRDATDAWLSDWHARVASESRDPALRRRDMRAVNPAFIPRNHRVQQTIDAAVEAQDLAPLDTLLAVTTRPYEDHPELAEYALPPESHEVVHQTFCGT